MEQLKRSVTVALSGVLLAGCTLGQSAEERALIAQFDMIDSREAFIAAAVGPQWRSDEIKVRFAETGGLSGDINGVPVTGQWEWRDGSVCTTFRVADSGGEGCSKVGIKPGELLVVPRNGSGAPYTYSTA